MINSKIISFNIDTAVNKPYSIKQLLDRIQQEEATDIDIIMMLHEFGMPIVTTRLKAIMRTEPFIEFLRNLAIEEEMKTINDLTAKAILVYENSIAAGKITSALTNFLHENPSAESIIINICLDRSEWWDTKRDPDFNTFGFITEASFLYGLLTDNDQKWRFIIFMIAIQYLYSHHDTRIWEQNLKIDFFNITRKAFPHRDEIYRKLRFRHYPRDYAKYTSTAEIMEKLISLINKSEPTTSASL
ncbi:hypothetical protein A2230_06560 [candidate division WOR-1 bacterium RIFOXYA2_FULL_36_21]|uniref:Uncharacterized protein n=1 Tax=candidate division WOR-1 bacterium RIFOXYB2_FULL_36_35 TaxID=1802578 RepID=A0A1F4S3C4_UNCSA|nr:MAG: hypothetical protein A2230_06560 [candidate division WOR-1 bacterium RIFOXYA2_FULL_36_21]OGC14918.1 MAG: hypothetical protein A2290_07460 [candidate division WOR-1 bacterium RIFOXYB2_FULL_36_35]OGC16747.1 MAG: hypothetical protein A2282_04015 [candidate division WOR-1 bacterium RIFOXYA12_FULL_36_13]